MMYTIKQSRPDLLHFHSGNVAAKLAPHAVALGLPYTVSIRGSDIQVRPLMDEQYAASLEQVLASAQRIHVVCDALGDAVLRICPSLTNIETIRTCVPIPDDIQPTSQTHATLSFISVGRLHWSKAYDDLIRAMALLPEATLTIVGDGPEREHLLFLVEELRLRERVQITGSLSYIHFVDMLLNATAYVQSSIAEGFSNALAEAMACGKLVFATPVGGTSEVICDGVNGIILPIANPSGIAQRLELARDSQMKRQLGEQARQTALQQFTSDRHATQFAKFFASALIARD